MTAHYEVEILEDNEDLTEPPVPPNLQHLSPALRNFIDFFDIDADLVATAAQASPKVSQPEKNLSIYIDRLSESEKHNFLERLLKDEVNLDITLATRLREVSGLAKADLPPPGDRRTLRQLMTTSGKITQQRIEKAKQKAEAIRLKKLGEIAQQEDYLWAQVSSLIDQKKVNAYDQAVNILKDLRDLAQHRNRLSQFRDKIHNIQQQYPRLTGLQRRLKKVGLF